MEGEEEEREGVEEKNRVGKEREKNEAVEERRGER